MGVVGYRLAPGRVSRWDSGAYAAPTTYVEAIRRAGGRPVLIAPPDDDPSTLLERFDGLLLIGGGDVEPHHYGAREHPELYGRDPDRDRLELDLVRIAAERSFPTLAICRGAQVVDVALGGTLYQHLPDLDGLEVHGLPAGAESAIHDVKLAQGSRLAEACARPVVEAYSSHHQGLDRLGLGLVPVAWAGDGLVEGVEHERGWLVGVQWHPEATAEHDPAQQALFDAFVRQAGASS